jgi:hypothetical protein
VAFSHLRLAGGGMCVMRKVIRWPWHVEPGPVLCRAHAGEFSGRPTVSLKESLASLGRRAAGGADRQPVFHPAAWWPTQPVDGAARHFVSVTGIEDQLVLQPLPFDVLPVHVEAVTGGKTTPTSGCARRSCDAAE